MHTRSFSLSRRAIRACIGIVLMLAVPQLARAATLTLAWDPSPSSNVAGYIVYSGTQAGVCVAGRGVDVGKVLSYPAVPNAVDGQQYFFAVSAYAVDNNNVKSEGACSNEISGYSNEPPSLANPGNRTSIINQYTSLQLNGSDPDGKPVSYTVTGLPPGLIPTLSTGFIDGTPTTLGSYTVTATVSDGVLSRSVQFTWTIATTPPPNQPPSVSLTAPADNATFSAPATITVSANASDSDGTVAKVDFFRGSTLIGTDASSPYSVTWSNVAAGSYSLTAVATDNSGATTTSAPRSITVTAPGPVPAPWTAADVGGPSIAGSTSYNGGTFTIRAAGSDIWNQSDQFHYVYQQVSGDVTIVARVASLGATDQWSKSGVMIRESLTGGSRNAAMIVSANNGLGFTRRTSTGGDSVITYGPSNQAPMWVKLDRRGSTITASYSSNGTAWTSLASDPNFTLPATFYVGLAVTSHNTGASTTSAVDSVSVTLIAPPVITATSSSPSSGTGGTQTFALQYGDTAGAVDLNTAWVWFSPSMTASSAGSCMVYYDRPANRVFLLNDAGAAYVSALMGAATTLQNNQCAIAVGSSSASASGNTLTVNLAMTFKPAFAGAKNIFLFGTNGAVNSGWQDRGDWTVPSGSGPVVAAVTASPSSGTGATQTFALTYGDTAGATDLMTGWVWFTPSMSSSSANSCMVYYDRPGNRVFLLNDAGASYLSGAMGSGTLQNSQCSIALGSSSRTVSGTTLTVNLAMTFKPAFAGAKNIFMFATNGTVNSGWQDRGDWTVPSGGAAVVTADSSTPGTGAGATQTFALRYSDTRGATDLMTAWVWFATSSSGSASNTCMAYYDRASNLFFFLNDAATAWSTAAPGANITLQNSQCSLNAAASSTSISGNTLTVNMAMTFKPAFSGSRSIFMYATNGAENSGWVDRGDWTMP